MFVICELLGVPPQDRDKFGAWSAAIGQNFDNLGIADEDLKRRGNEAASGLTEYFRELVRARRGRPADDILQGLISAEEQGEPELAVLVVRQSDGLPGQGWWVGGAKKHGYSGLWEGPGARRLINRLQAQAFDYWSSRG